MRTSLPRASSAYAIASCDPMESPSGRACEVIRKRRRACIASQISVFGVVILQAGGLRPAGPPCTLARGDPTIPAPLAWLSRCRSVALAGGLRPAGPPCTLARGDPTIPAPLVSGRRGPLHPAWLTALRSRFVARSAPLARLSRCRAVASRVGLGLQLLEDLLDAVVLG